MIELSRNQPFQIKLHEELTTHFSAVGDPTYDQLTNSLPYLDAVVHEVLRFHPPVWQTVLVVRNFFLSAKCYLLILTLDQAAEDDIIPLSAPLQTADNKIVDRVSIAAGQTVAVPIRTINRSTSIWGADAKEFKPQRWLEEGGPQGKAKEVQGYRHLLTFVDGPRACLGRGFALAEFKVCKFIFACRIVVDSEADSAADDRQLYRCSSGTIHSSCEMAQIPRSRWEG